MDTLGYGFMRRIQRLTGWIGVLSQALLNEQPRSWSTPNPLLSKPLSDAAASSLRKQPGLCSPTSTRKLGLGWKNVSRPGCQLRGGCLLCKFKKAESSAKNRISSFSFRTTFDFAW